MPLHKSYSVSQISEARLAGKTLTEIAKTTGLSPSKIRSILISCNFPPLRCNIHPSFQPIINKASHHRFWRYVNKNGPMPDQSVLAYAGLDNCWVWLGPTANGYGQIMINKQRHQAHAWMWKHDNNRNIPSDMWVLHKCDFSLCVNPSHLYLGSPKDNSVYRDKKYTTTKPESGTKQCNNCGEVKFTADFSIITDRRGSRVSRYPASFCKPCQSQRVMANQRKHKDRVNKYARERREKEHKKNLEIQEYYKQTPSADTKVLGEEGSRKIDNEVRQSTT